MGKILKIIFKIFRINFTKIKKINNNFIEKYRNENCENVCNLSTTYELVSIPKNIFHPPKKSNLKMLKLTSQMIMINT